MKRIRILALLLVAGNLTACFPFKPRFNPPQITQLQLRAIQTRDYAEPDANRALKTVLNVLQDDGYIVRFGEPSLGLLSANKNIVDFNSDDFRTVMGSDVLGDPPPTLQASTVLSTPTASVTTFSTTYGPGDIVSVEATANVSRFGDKTRLRVSFERKVTSRDGQVINASPVHNPKYYQEFFAKVDKGLFLDHSGL